MRQSAVSFAVNSQVPVQQRSGALLIRLYPKPVEREEHKMQITDIRVRTVNKEGRMKAVVSITIDNEFAVHDIKVIDGEKGLFIEKKNKKTLDGEYRDIAHPINSQTRERLQSLILEEYEKALAADSE